MIDYDSHHSEPQLTLDISTVNGRMDGHSKMCFFAAHFRTTNGKVVIFCQLHTKTTINSIDNQQQHCPRKKTRSYNILRTRRENFIVLMLLFSFHFILWRIFFLQMFLMEYKRAVSGDLFFSFFVSRHLIMSI